MRTPVTLPSTGKKQANMMNVERQGFYREHGRGSTSYRSFVPRPLQEVELQTDDKLDALLKQAHEHLQATADADELEREARSSVNLAYGEPELSLTSGASNPQKEADLGFLRDTMKYSLEHRRQLPLSGRLLKDLHWVMMRGEHNEKKYPGEFRTSPIWMGDESDTLTTAPFVPPVEPDMMEAFYQLENYINYEEHTDPLIMAALIHYQFEAIHPFIDGNGRMGRLLTLLFLMDRGVISQFSVPLSTKLNLRQFRYFTGLASVEISGTYERWVKFFLEILAE